MGIWNTCLGYSAFIVLYYAFGQAKAHYLLAMFCSQAICILNAYLCYKYFVFRARGLTFQEPLRFVLVYGFNFLANLILLPLLMSSFHMNPVLAQGIVVVLTVVASYFGHNHFSFRPAAPLVS